MRSGLTMGKAYDVMVVGAGPVGSYVARRLADQGHSVIVFERQAAVGNAVCCTGIVSKECFDRFPVPEVAVAAQGNSCKVFSPSGRSVRLWKNTVQAYIVDRPAFDRQMAQAAQEAGAEYVLSARVDGVSLFDHRVRADVIQSGRRLAFDGRMVVISNGFSFSLPRKLGLGKVGDYVLGAQTEVEANGVDEVEVYLGQDVAPGFFGWLVPRTGGKALVGLLARKSPGPRMKAFLSRLEAEGKIGTPLEGINYGGIPLKPLPRTYTDRVVVVGDAAGHVKPTTGGGIYYGLIGADIAVETIHEAICDGDCSARRLGSYERRWKRLLGRELRVGYWARRLYERFGDRQIDHLFSLVETHGVHEAILQSPDFSFDWHASSITKAMKHRELRQAIWSAARSLLPF
jgi:digeranylgeranylglycerophospholipid reductase